MPNPYVGQLGAVGLAKEPSVNTYTAPTRYIPTHLPMNIGSPDIALLLSKGVRSVPDLVYKVQQGAASLKSGKFKFEVEPENVGECVMGAMGTDTPVETASFTVATGVNDTIDFVCAAGTEAATIAAGTYPAGANSGTDPAGTMCKLISAAMHTADTAHTYTVTYSVSTNKFTIATSQATGTFSLLFLSGTNNAKTICALISFTKADQTGAFTYTGTVSVKAAFTHTFSRLAAAQLPTYTIWVNTGIDFPVFTGCMVNKLDIDIKAADYVMVDVDWVGSKYDSVDGVTEALSYSSLNPMKYDQAVITVAGSPVTLYKNVKLSIDNKVKVDPVIGGSIYSNVIYSESFDVKFSATIVVEDLVEWTKFINGTLTSFTIALTSKQFVNGAIPYSLTITLPSLAYSAAPRPLANGLIEVTFQAQGVYSVANTETLSIALVNSVGTSY